MKKQTTKRLITLLLAAVLSIGIYLYERNCSAEQPKVFSSEFTLTVLGLDKADCIVLQSGGSVVLCDGGENSDAGDVVGFLLAQKITHIDVMIASHPHSDHIGGLDDVLNEESIQVDALIEPDIPENQTEDLPTVRDFNQAVTDNGVKKLSCKAGDVYDVNGDIKLTVLAPIGNDHDELNAWSAVVRADCGDVSVLLTGDTTVAEEKKMLENPQIAALLDCDILKVAHHGGTTSSGMDFLRAVSPQIALITARADAEDDYLTETVVGRLGELGAKVCDTRHNGRIICTQSEGKLRVNTQKSIE
ncbi:MAG TPA: MBL fold metallo-hydrolase [Oscillospiraceae bacterium]|nr:MBL fold metallo-hydrolase [Oscillospiraceae bacterium]HPS34202.1 MBL fold metallo-hydrolase [Oscillospiraceae bacterium]